MYTILSEEDALYRLDLPREERRHPWLGYAFDLFAMVDASVAHALAASGREPGCSAGCCACCAQPIPVTPLEVAALRWYVREGMPPDRAAVLRDGKDRMAPNGNIFCRFLLGGGCAAYPVRPVACRRYMALGKPCGAAEDASQTRPGDLLAPSRDALNRAFAWTLPYYAALGENVPEPEGAFVFMAAHTVDLAGVSVAVIGKKM